MTTIDNPELEEITRLDEDERATDLMDTMPELLHDAARNCKPWAIVTSFFVAPDSDPNGWNGKLADLPHAPRLVHHHLKESGLNPGFFVCHGMGHLPNGEAVQGTWYRLTANWENAPEDNPLRQVYEAAVQTRARKIIDQIPQMVADTSARERGWAKVYKFFTPAPPHPLAFDGNPENLKGIPHLLYEHLSQQNLAPRLRCIEGEGEFCCTTWGHIYYLTAHWPRSGDNRSTAHPEQ